MARSNSVNNRRVKSSKGTKSKRGMKSSKSTKSRTRRAKTQSPESNLLKKLFDAITGGNVATVKRLVGAGALNNKDIRLQGGTIGFISSMKSGIANTAVSSITQGWAGVTARDALQIFRLLRDNGLEFSHRTIMPDVFLDAWSYKVVFDELIKNGYDVNTVDAMGNSMLMLVMANAAREDTQYTQEHYADIINRLFDLGADINIQNDFGLDALMVATGHDALEEFWYYFFDGGLGNDIKPKPYYVNLLLENVKRTRQRYNFENSAANSDDAEADRFTLEESLSSHVGHAEYDETVALIQQYKLALRKPTKGVNMTKKRSGGKSK